MPKNSIIPSPIKNAIVRAKNDGETNSLICKRFEVARSTVQRIYSRWKATKSIKRSPKTGRTRKITKREERILARAVKKDPELTSTFLVKEASQRFQKNISNRTACRILNRAQLFARRPAMKALISKKNRKARLRFAREHKNWTPAQWGSVLWSDESKFNLFGSDGPKWIRRPIGERYNVRYTRPTVKHSASVMVWGIILLFTDIIKIIIFRLLQPRWNWPSFQSGGHYGPLHVSGYFTTTYAPPFEGKMAPEFYFQHDNDPKHTSRVVSEWLAGNGIRVLSWPAQSPDLNPIEHLWNELERRLKTRKCTRQDTFFQALEEEWRQIPMDILMHLVDSMPRRCEAVIRAKGFPTKY